MEKELMLELIEHLKKHAKDWVTHASEREAEIAICKMVINDVEGIIEWDKEKKIQHLALVDDHEEKGCKVCKEFAYFEKLLAKKKKQLADLESQSPSN